MSGPVNLHASCVLLGEAGVLIRGEAGVGKSSLAVRLVAARRAAGRFAAHVSDDRTIVSVANGRLIARPHPAIAGLVERRGLGLVRVPCEGAAILRLVVDLQREPGPRLPDEDERTAILEGVLLARLAGRPEDVAPLVEEALSWPG